MERSLEGMKSERMFRSTEFERKDGKYSEELKRSTGITTGGRKGWMV